MNKLFSLLISLICFLAFTSSASAQIYTNEKMITVNLAGQQLTAWNEGKIVHQTKVSTGMAKTPTVKGSFKIYYKTPMQDMRGPSPYKNIYPTGKYHIKNVPHVMFFHEGYGIHGAYWHNNFGRVASHGCVNVPLASAEWLYNFADKGTRVEVF